jgi:tetratricopeptide (TPR) repeat protein
VKIARLILAFLTLAVLLKASPEQDLKGANALYKKGDFPGAAQAYRGILSSGVEDWRVYFNLGNASYKQKDFGRAVLNFEKALKLNPQDARLRGNLDFVRLQLKDRFQEDAQGATARLLNSLFNILSTEETAASFLGIFLLLQILWTVYLLRKDPGLRTAVTLASSVLLALLLILGPLLAVKLYRAHGVDYGVLLAPTVTAKSAPQADATNLFVAHEGTKLRLFEQVEGWRRVALPNGLTGFVPLESFEKI